MLEAGNGKRNKMKATPAADRAALWMTEEEADVVMRLLLSTGPPARVPDKLAERLRDRVASVARTVPARSGCGCSNDCGERDSYDRILDYAG